MINKIEKIYRIWWVIENAHIVPKRQAKLKQIARVRSGIYSTRIEWNKLSYEEATKLLDWEKINARPRDVQELKNYMKVLDYIESKESSKIITEKDIFKIHQLTTKKILDTCYHNKRRNEANAVYNPQWWIIYLPPDWVDVPQLIKELLNFINTNTDIPTIIRAWLLHHWFVIIHPFIDGNGRTARALTQLFLYQNWFNTKKYFSLEEYYDNDLVNYYSNIFIWNDYYSVEEEIDSSRFIEYFLGWIENELWNLQSTIEKISNDEDFENNLIVARLNNRQIHIATYIIKNLSVSSKELLNEYNITKATLKRDLKTLIDNEIIKSVGKGKATKYESAKKNKNTANSIEKETNI